MKKDMLGMMTLRCLGKLDVNLDALCGLACVVCEVQ